MSEVVPPDPSSIQPTEPRSIPSEPMSSTTSHLLSIVHNFSDRLDRSSYPNQNLHKIFDHLQLIKDIVTSNYLTSDQSQELSTMIEEMQVSFFDNAVKIHQVQDELDFAISQLSTENPKVRTISMIHDLQDLLCTHPPQNLPPVSVEEFHSYTDPIKEKIASPNLTNFYATTIARQLEHIRDDFMANPTEQIQIVLYRLEHLSKDIQSF